MDENDPDISGVTRSLTAGDDPVITVNVTDLEGGRAGRLTSRAAGDDGDADTSNWPNTSAQPDPGCGIFAIYPKASLGDYVWRDIDEDGIQDAGESGISGVTVELIDPVTDTVIDTTTTDGTGFMSFTDLDPDEYAVRFIAPAGYTLTSQDSGSDDGLDSDADPTTGRTPTVTLAVP